MLCFSDLAWAVCPRAQPVLPCVCRSLARCVVLSGASAGLLQYYMRVFLPGACSSLTAQRRLCAQQLGHGISRPAQMEPAPLVSFVVALGLFF